MRTFIALVFVSALSLSSNATPSVPHMGTGVNPDRAGHADMVGRLPNEYPAPEQPPGIAPKTLSDGIYMSGSFTYLFTGGAVGITLDKINNTSGSTSGTLRLSLWATTYQPSRGASLTGYRLVNFITFDPLPSGNYYYNIVRASSTYSPPPNGTYWIVLVLDEYDPSGCPSNADGFCLEDSGIYTNQMTFGPVAQPAALENPSPGSYQSGIGIISGWSCQGPVSVGIDGKTPTSIPYGGPRGDTASACGGAANNGFGLLLNYNNLGAGAHTAQLYVNGTARGGPVSFLVTVPQGEFATGLSRTITVPNFPSTGRTTTLIWQESQQNFAIQSVAP